MRKKGSELKPREFARQLREAAETFRSSFRADFEIEIAYDLESLELLDSFREVMIDMIPDESKEGCVFLLGAYFGEVLRHAFGGEWDIGPLDGLGLRVDRKHFYCPFSTAEDWLAKSEEEESLAFHFRATRQLISRGME